MSNNIDPPSVSVPQVLRDMVLQSATEAMVLLKGDRVVEANDCYARLIGYGNRDEVISLSLLTIVAPNCLDQAQDFVSMLTLGLPVPESLVYDCIRKDGSTIRVEATVVSWPIDTTYAVAIVRDITKRERDLAALEQSERLYRALAETMPAGVVLTGIDGKIVYANAHAMMLTGYLEDDLTARILPFHSEEEKDRGLYLRSLEQGVAGRLSETRLETEDGQDLWVSISWNPLLGQDSKLKGSCTVFIDLTEKRRTESALRNTEEQYSLLAENASDVIWQLDNEGRFTYISPAISKYGYQPNEVIGRHFTEILPEHERAWSAAELEIAAQQGETVLAELQMSRKDGSLVWLELSVDFVTENGVIISTQGIARDISDRKEVELALKASEERYRGIVESQRDLVVRVDKQGRFTFVNDAYCLKFGKSVDELLGRSFVHLVHKDDIPATLAAMEELKSPPYRCSVEQRAATVDGWRWIAWEDYAIVDESGDIVEIQAVGRDVHKQKLSEQALRETEERYRLLAENATDILWQMDLNGVYTYVSQAVTRIMGYSQEECVGKTLFDFVPAHEQEYLRSQFPINIDNKDVRHYEIQMIKKDGSLVWMEVSVNLVVKEGKPIRLQGIARDIDERKKAERALRESELRFRTLVNNIPGAVFRSTYDGEWSIQYLSNAIEDISGYPASEFLNGNSRGFSTIVHPEDAASLDKAFKQAVETKGGAYVAEYRILHADGDIRWVYEKGRVTFITNDTICVDGAIFDVTDRKLADEATREAHANLEKAYNLQGQFLDNVTHEVRTPLTAVQGYAKMLLEGTFGDVSSDQAALLEKILCSSNHLLELVTEVLEIARIRSGVTALRPRVCNPVHLVERTVESIAPQAKQKGLALEVKLPEKCCLGMYDQEKVQIILSNLLSNAVKFTESGGIEVQLSSTSLGCEIVICDTGMGISQDKLGMIFEEFVQLDYPGKHKPVGFGIGLAIVASMVDTIGAELTVSSCRGLGSAFTVSIPVCA